MHSYFLIIPYIYYDPIIACFAGEAITSDGSSLYLLYHLFIFQEKQSEVMVLVSAKQGISLISNMKNHTVSLMYIEWCPPPPLIAVS